MRIEGFRVRGEIIWVGGRNRKNFSEVAIWGRLVFFCYVDLGGRVFVLGERN